MGYFSVYFQGDPPLHQHTHTSTSQAHVQALFLFHYDVGLLQHRHTHTHTQRERERESMKWKLVTLPKGWFKALNCLWMHYGVVQAQLRSCPSSDLKILVDETAIMYFRCGREQAKVRIPTWAHKARSIVGYIHTVCHVTFKTRDSVTVIVITT